MATKKRINNYFYSFEFDVNGNQAELEWHFQHWLNEIIASRPRSDDLTDHEACKIALVTSMNENDGFRDKNLFILKFLRGKYNFRPKLIDKDYDYATVIEDIEVGQENTKTPTQMEELYSYSILKLFLDNEVQKIRGFISHERVTNWISKSHLTSLLKDALSEAFALPELKNSMSFELKPVFSSTELANIEWEVLSLRYTETIDSSAVANRLRRQINWTRPDQSIELKCECTTRRDANFFIQLLQNSVGQTRELPITKFEVRTTKWKFKEDAFYLSKIIEVELQDWNMTIDSKPTFIRELAYFLDGTIYANLQQ